MQASFSRLIRAAAFPVACLLAFCGAAQAQQHKGDKEILFFFGGFWVGVDEQTQTVRQTPITRMADQQARSLNLGVILLEHERIGAGTRLCFSFPFWIAPRDGSHFSNWVLSW